jgi:hypothetical protein
MTEITAKTIEKELKKIAFFVQYSGLFDDFPPRTRNVLEDLPVEWDSVQTDGSIDKEKLAETDELREDTNTTWKEADLVGTLGEKPFKMKIKRGNKRTTYEVIYDGKKYPTSSLDKLESLVERLQQGKPTRQEMMLKAYKTIQKNNSNILRYSQQYYLNQASNKKWNLKLDRNSSQGTILLRFFVRPDNEAEHQNVKNQLQFDNNMRINAVGSYIKNKILPSSGIDTTELVMTQKILNMPDKTGFLITIK